ncbi:D-erythronate dehydrogenase [uncultured Roseibium sp.]|uniref:D-erythronate dehydrogenase n=1 Tax=uncultured Roseibium sp. TaxID=1936171 RepID=UPI0032168A0A
MVKVLVIGAAGMIGRKLVDRLVSEQVLGGREIGELLLADVVAPSAPAGAPCPVETIACDFSEPGQAEALMAKRPEIIFHLAAIVSGEAEADFEKGYRINLHGTQRLFEAIRLAGDGYCPRVVFTSSIAVFGAPFPDPIPDDFHLTPLTSYGTQKAIGELLLADLTRQGMMDGIGIRLPTVVVRPGKPNAAASGFFSGIIREPLNGQEAKLPVGDDVLHWMASPRASVGFLIHAANMDGEKIGPRRSLTMPGLPVTVGEEIDALRRIGGEERVKLIRREPDEAVQRIVAGWPRQFDAARAVSLGFEADASFDEIVRIYIEEEGINL